MRSGFQAWQRTPQLHPFDTVTTKKPRLNITLNDIEREKLEKLAEESGLSLSRTIAQLIRKAKLKESDKKD
jgi:macrodomain Ter protein organizer (MatP/YcbG family)